MNIEPIQDSIVTALADGSNSSFIVLNQPEKESDFKRAVLKPVAFVAYIGSVAPDSSKTLNIITQPRILTFQVQLFSMLLYGATGMYAMRDLVEQALIGFIPLSCNRMYLVKDDLVDAETNIFSHAYLFECTTLAVQQGWEEPPPGFNNDFNPDFNQDNPVLTTVDANENFYIQQPELLPRDH